MRKRVESESSYGEDNEREKLLRLETEPSVVLMELLEVGMLTVDEFHKTLESGADVNVRGEVGLKALFFSFFFFFVPSIALW